MNRHPVDLFRLFLFKPNREVVDRFVEEGIIERDEVEVIRKGWKGVGIGVAVSPLREEREREGRWREGGRSLSLT